MMYRSIDSCCWWRHFWQTLRCLWISFTYTGLSCSEQACAWWCCLESYYPFSPKHINPDSWAYSDIPFHCVLRVRVNALSLSVAVSCIPWRRACASRGNSCWWWISSRKTLTWRGIPMKFIGIPREVNVFLEDVRWNHRKARRLEIAKAANFTRRNLWRISTFSLKNRWARHGRFWCSMVEVEVLKSAMICLSDNSMYLYCLM